MVHSPVPTPAKYAAPSAVVRAISNTLTDTANLLSIDHNNIVLQ